MPSKILQVEEIIPVLERVKTELEALHDISDSGLAGRDFLALIWDIEDVIFTCKNVRMLT